MYLNNYWKYKLTLEKYFSIVTDGYNTTGYASGINKYTGESIGYMLCAFSRNKINNGQANYNNPMCYQARGLCVEAGVKFGAGDHTIDADDYNIGGTDITADFTSVTISVIPAVDDGYTYDIIISATYNGSGTTLKRVGVTKDVYCNSVQSQELNNLSTYKAPVLMISHELSEPITLNNGDPVNIIIKVTQK
jgi:hypothetical protein